MKATEYATSYHDTLAEGGLGTVSLFSALADEAYELTKTRHAMRAEAKTACLMEVNQKYHAILARYKKLTGEEAVVSEDAFLEYASELEWCAGLLPYPGVSVQSYYDLVKDYAWDRADVYRYLMALHEESRKHVAALPDPVNSEVVKVLRMMNDKHNAIMAKFVEDFGEQPLIPDMLIRWWLSEQPDFAAMFPEYRPLGEEVGN